MFPVAGEAVLTAAFVVAVVIVAIVIEWLMDESDL